MAPASYFVLQKSLSIPAPSEHVLRLVNKSPSYITQIQMAFQTSASTLYLCGVVCCAISVRVGTLFLISSLRAKPQFVKYPELSPLVVQTLEVKSHWISKPNVWGLIFPGQVPHVWDSWCGVCSSPFPVLVVSVPFVVSSHWSLVLFPSTPFLCGLLSKINCRVCSTSLCVIFWISCTDVIIIQVYPCGKVSLESSYSIIFLVSDKSVLLMKKSVLI